MIITVVQDILIVEGSLMMVFQKIPYYCMGRAKYVANVWIGGSTVKRSKPHPSSDSNLILSYQPALSYNPPSEFSNSPLTYSVLTKWPAKAKTISRPL